MVSLGDFDLDFVYERLLTIGARRLVSTPPSAKTNTGNEIEQLRLGSLKVEVHNDSAVLKLPGDTRIIIIGVVRFNEIRSLFQELYIH
jgi:hypothetical protein